MMMSAVGEGAQQQREDQSHCIQDVGIGEQAASSSRRELLLDLLLGGIGGTEVEVGGLEHRSSTYW